MKSGARIVIVFFILLSHISHPGSGQTFRNLKDSNGKSLSDVRAAVQDREGFLWFATFDGLFRYDSRTLKQYRHSTTDPNSISSDLLKALFCDSKGDLWVGGSRGLDRYNRETDNFTHIEHNLPNTNSGDEKHIYFISEDRDHRILVGTAFGLNSLVVTKNGTKISHILHRTFEESTQTIGSVSQTRNGDFWAGSFNGLIQVPGKGAPRLFRINSTDKSPSVNQFAVQYMDDRNVIWLGPGSGGIVRFDITTERFTPITEFVGQDGKLPIVYKIFPDGHGKMWIASYSGLALFDPVSRKSIWYKNKLGDVHSLPDNYVQSICLDQQGGVWLGSYYSGITNFYPNSPQFTPWPSDVKGSDDIRYADSYIGASKNGTLWLIDKDLNRLRFFDRSGTSTNAFRLNLRPKNHYSRFYLDKGNTLWAAGYSVLTSYDPETGAYHDYPMTVQGQKELEAGQVYNIFEDSRGRFWLIGSFGAILFDKQTGRFTKYKGVSYALSIFEDSRHHIWIGGSDEVFLLRQGKSDFEELFTDKSTSDGNFASVWRMAEDRKGRIWAITRQGLQLFDPRSGKFLIDPKVQLSRMQDIQVDHSGYVWLATEADLTRYHPDLGTLQTYGPQDGIPFNGITRPACSVQGLDGSLYFLANQGVFHFSPARFKTQNNPSPIVFTGLMLSDREIKPGDDTRLLTRSLNRTKNLALKHDQNIFSISFALLSYPRSERNRYAYKLEGFNDKWTFTANPSATYMNLPPGDYVFNVRAANGDGFWNTRPAQLKITILPPWWRTWYAYLCYVFLALAAIYAVTRFFWLRSTFIRENALHQLKLDFFTNISHEIRTHLSLISGPLEQVYEQFKGGQDIENNLNYARSNSERLMLLVNELLDFRKIQSGGLILKVREHNVVKIVKNVLAAFEHTAHEKNIETTLTSTDTEVLLWFDIAQMQKVFYNLISNAYKFTPEGGKIVVRIVETSNEVVISVEDNGKGIPQEHLRKLFHYYYQADSEQPGYGIGLALSKSIVEQHHGYLTAESRAPSDKSPGQTVLNIRMLRENRHFASGQLDTANGNFADNIMEEAVSMPLPTHTSTSTRTNTILIIEDNDELRAFIAELFQGEFNILEADGGLRGLELAGEHMPDIILSDVMMPGIDGLEVCKRLKADNATAHIPVVLLTARTQSEQVIEGLTAGVDDYLIKPFDPRILRLKINILIRLRDEMKERYRQSVFEAPLPAIGVAQNMNDAFIDRLRTIVIENISDPDFGVNEIAVRIGISVSPLYRKMRSLTGMTLNEFVKAIRLNEAKKLLESGSFSVKEVAWMIGFEDAKYFSKEFTKVFGKTPIEFKRRA